MTAAVLEKPDQLRLPQEDFYDDLHLHLAEPEERSKALRGEPYRTLCGIQRPFLRHVVVIATDDPMACVLCTRIYDKAFI